MSSKRNWFDWERAFSVVEAIPHETFYTRDRTMVSANPGDVVPIFCRRRKSGTTDSAMAPLRWQSEITAWEPPFRFVDTQIRGPYRAWIHEHAFESRDGKTVMRDRVQYGVVGGSLIQKFLVVPDLSKIFEFRRIRLASLFGSTQ